MIEALGLTMRNLMPDRESSRIGKRSRKSSPSTIIETKAACCCISRFDSIQRAFAIGRRKTDGQWIWKMNGVRRVLYKLPELLKADLSEAVIIVEGEKDVDRLRSLGFVATCNVGGAGKWRDEYNSHLAARHVVLCGDNDDPGRKHVEQVARSLSGIAASVRILNLDGLPSKGDVSDWCNSGHTAEELRGLLAAAPAWEPERPFSPPVQRRASVPGRVSAATDSIVHGRGRRRNRL